MNVNWQGVYPAVTTQFHDDESINFDTTKEMIDNLINEGVHGIIVLGTVGENCSLTADEKRQVLKAATEVVGDRVPLLSGVAETTTALAVEFAKDAEALGIDGLMVLPGMVYRSTECEAIHHYQQVARSTALPIMIYNNPVTYGVDVSIEGMKTLAEESNIVSVKEATEDTRRISELFSAFGDRYVVFGGVDDIALESLMLGATGWISGLTNVFPRESVAIYKLAEQGRYEEARALWRWFLPLLRLDTIPTLVQCIKYAEHLAGRGSEVTRSPRLPLTQEQKAYVSRLYDEAMANRIDLSQYNLD
ncbi:MULTISPECIES: dihydrodipicolinate synthase family protein [unclassified Pseudoalteromonas]|jgi:4-hydroxy-tetrahydrodipicolinate synthase|uniref:dihydrodipicolinate synthase family protein n=1 Tax=unclassified Pseudoalteromonas TaxID=194690 RepID=UPI001BAD26B0|nr:MULTISPECIES: dihydrodipicolinate synthase family protein [unclassified Pseudoalteromonas]MCF2826501.1 dihydrodipicolinate synthase family protein [Pseudoalteromonas sp. OF5H-5]MCF2832511.1 dihydrodipicolinate synthase family protein [Pseudoalteromonas sp. DL2-H6]MCF2924720.1 dihydrodipicolinate synthase family protein [Pseudoalteromonas sp. DL2-H1]MCG7552117.1 dihydrodipicolinate synthase family protein [Pseudoalteromonas sp. Of11M-6]QUI70820.1 dihydrodipicolinate synthase family protein [